MSTPTNTRNLRSRLYPNLTHQFASAAAHMVSSNLIHQTQIKDALLNSVINPNTGVPMEYRQLSSEHDKAVWTTAFANNLGRLVQGIGKEGMPHGTNTLFFIPPLAIPKGKQSPTGAWYPLYAQKNQRRIECALQ